MELSEWIQRANRGEIDYSHKTDVVKHDNIDEWIKRANHGEFDDNHKTVVVKHNNIVADIDEMLSFLILDLWKNDINTTFSCQGNESDENSGYISFKSYTDIIKFFNCYSSDVKDLLTIDCVDRIGSAGIKFCKFNELMEISDLYTVLYFDDIL